MNHATPRLDRAFLITDRRTNQPAGLCTGPLDDGTCPHAHGSHVPCGGRRVTPIQGTSANGLPFTVADVDYSGCPMSWLYEAP